jgi:hypothetical protein
MHQIVLLSRGAFSARIGLVISCAGGGLCIEQVASAGNMLYIEEHKIWSKGF